MPYVHHYTLKVRHYECDADEFVNPANYLRYMQEAAFAGSAAVGYTPQRYNALGYWWLAYETDLTFHSPLTYGDDITIKTWVVDFRRVRSLRRYEFYRGGELVAEASTDWVLLDVNTLRPASIPDDMIAAYSQGGVAPTAPRPKPQLPQSKPPAATFTMNRHSQWSELDPARHVNNAVYLAYVVDAEVMAFNAIGWSPERLRDNGLRMVTRRYQLEYKQAASLGDEIEVETWFSQLNETGGYQHFIVRNGKTGTLFTRVRREWQCIDRTSLVPTALPVAMQHELKGLGV